MKSYRLKRKDNFLAFTIDYQQGKHFNKRQKFLITLFLHDLYNHYKMRANLYVYIGYFDYDPKAMELASCSYLDDWYRPREFSVHVAKEYIISKNVFELLSHEFSHIEQYIRKRAQLKMIGGKLNHFWNGENYTKEVNELAIFKKREDYDMLPWEIEARQTEILGTNFYNSLTQEQKSLFKDETQILI